MLKTKSEIKQWLDENGVKNYIINDDLAVDVMGHVDLNDRGLIKIPIQFGVVTGNFCCEYNELTSLDGCPKIANCFVCNVNQLTSLKGCPQTVYKLFRCSNNKLIDLEYCPKNILNSFDCSHNKLISLKHIPIMIDGNFYCQYNNLTSLQHLPIVKGKLFCDDDLKQTKEYKKYLMMQALRK